MAKSRKGRPTASRPAPLEGNEVWKQRSRVRTSGPTKRVEASVWERMPTRWQHVICIGFLFIVAAGFYSTTTFGGKAFVAGDTVQWRATAAAQKAYEADTGDLALWAPNVFGGMPGFLVSYPQAVPGADTVVGFFRGLGLWPFAHMFVLLVGTYLLVVYLTRTTLPAVLAAVGYGLSTYLPIILTAGHNTKFVALAYAPWLLLAFAALVRREPGMKRMKSVFLTLLFAIAASVNLRAGHVQITYYVVLVAGIWWVAEGVASFRDGTFRTWAFSTGLLAAGSALALALVAQPYLALQEFKAFTTRGTAAGGGLAWDYAMAWSQGWGELLTLVIPDAYGGGGALYWGPKVFTAGPHYVGPVVALLALIGAVGVARRSVAAFVAAAVLMTGFALGSHFEILNRAAFAAIPLFDTFRVPETWLAAVALVIALLAGWGGYYLMRHEATPEAEARKRRVAGGASVALLLLIGGLYITGGAGLSFQKEGETAQVRASVEEQAAQAGVPPTDPQVAQAVTLYMERASADRQAAFSGDAGRSLLLLVLASVLVALVLTRRVPAYAALTGLVLLATFDLWGVGRRYVSDDAPSIQRASVVPAAIPMTDADRFIAASVEAEGPGRFRVLPQNPLSTSGPSAYAESVGGYNGVRLKIFEDYLTETLPDEQTGYNLNALRLLGVRYVIVQGRIPGLEPVFVDAATDQTVLEDPNALPRAYFVDRVDVVPDADETRARVRDPRTVLTEAAFIPAEVPGVSAEALSGAPADSGATSVQLDRFRPDEIVWRVRTDRPRLFVASEVYYPAGWTATVGTAEVPIVQVDGLIRGIPVPAGDHVVAMRFRPEAHRTSLVISWVAFLVAYGGLLVLGGLVWFRKGKDS